MMFYKSLYFAAAAAAKSLQLCLTLCDPIDWCLAGSSIYGILQARILEWVVIPSPGYLPDPNQIKSNPVFLNCRQILYCLSHQGIPTNLLSRFSRVRLCAAP